jgi:hypothetical protein
MLGSFMANRRRLGRLAVLLAACVLAAIAAEYTTRWILRDVTTTSDNRGYFTRRWLRTGAAQLNAAGFRDREVTPDKPTGVFRVAAVGDSFTFGNGIRRQDRYTDLVQARLPSTIEVLNFGRAGDNTPEHLELVRTIVPKYRPDFVLLQWYVNDVEDSTVNTGRPVFRPLAPLPSWHEWLSMNSALYGIANLTWSQAQVGLGLTFSYADFLDRSQRDPNNREALLDQKLLNELITFAQGHGVPVGMVLFPDTTGERGDRYPFAYLHERVLANCEARQIRCVDLRKDFAEVRDRRQLWANRLDHHPGRRANAIAAERILETFAASWATGQGGK